MSPLHASRAALKSLACSFVLAMFLSPSSWAVDENETVGFQSGHLLDSGTFGENIDVLNGGLNLSLPLGPRYKVGQYLSYQLVLSYGSKIWDHTTENHIDKVYRRSPFGLGFGLHFGRIYKDVETVGGSSVCRWVFVTPDGNEHEFPVQNGDPCTTVPIPGATTTDTQYFGMGYYLNSLVGWNGTGTAPLLTVSTADEQIAYYLDHFVQTYTYSPSGLLPINTGGTSTVTPSNEETNYNRDFGGWYVTRIEEVHHSNHYLEVRYQDQDGTPAYYRHLIRSAHDSLGRTILFANECAAPDGTSACYGIPLPAGEENRHGSARIKQITMPAFKASEAVEDGEAQPPPPDLHTATFDFTYEYVPVNNVDTNGCGNPTDCPQIDVNVLTAIQYPATMTSPRPTMSFEYGEVPRVKPLANGEVHRRILPTGGAISYAYGSYSYLSGDTRQVVQKSISASSDVNAPFVSTSYRRQAYEGGTIYTNPKYVTVTDGSGNDTEYYYRGSYEQGAGTPSQSNPDYEDGFAPEWDDGVNERVEYYEGTGGTRRLVRAVTRSYESDRDTTTSKHTARNLRVARESTVFHDDGDGAAGRCPVGR